MEKYDFSLNRVFEDLDDPEKLNKLKRVSNSGLGKNNLKFRKMKKKDSLIQYVDSHIIKRLRIYMIVLLIMLIIIVLEVLMGSFPILLVIGGIIAGMFIGILVSRTYRLSWDEDNHNVIDRMDRVGAVILILYWIFIFTRTSILQYWVHGASLMAIILSLTAGTMLASFLITRRVVGKILKKWNII